MDYFIIILMMIASMLCQPETVFEPEVETGGEPVSIYRELPYQYYEYKDLPSDIQIVPIEISASEILNECFGKRYPD